MVLAILVDESVPLGGAIHLIATVDATHIEPPQAKSRHRRGESYAVHAKSILGGLHHEYLLAPDRV
jgi:hypothetical protein